MLWRPGNESPRASAPRPRSCESSFRPASQRISESRVYSVAAVSVGASVLLRFALAPWLGLRLPDLSFFPAILVSAAGTAALDLAPPPRYLGAGGDALLPAAGGLRGRWLGRPVLPAALRATGLRIAWLSHQFRCRRGSPTAVPPRAQGRPRRASRRRLQYGRRRHHRHQRTGRSRSFNRGAERLFGYPEAEVARPQRQHADAVAVSRGARRLSRSATSTTGDAKIIGIGREVTGRRRDGTHVSRCTCPSAR